MNFLLKEPDIKIKHKKRLVFIFESLNKYNLFDLKIKDALLEFGYKIFIHDKSIGLKCMLYNLFKEAGFDIILDDYFKAMDQEEVKNIIQYSIN